MTSKRPPAIAPAPPSLPEASLAAEGAAIDTAAQGTKSGKRKRLSKACDACHKSKRRCDGTAPCSNCYFADKECCYTNSSGRQVPAPRAMRPDALPPLSSLDHHGRGASSGSEDAPTYQSSRQNTHQPEASSSRVSNATAQAHQSLAQRQTRQYRDVTAYARPAPPASHAPLDHHPLLNSHSSTGYPPAPRATFAKTVDLEPALVRELVSLFFAHCHPQRLVIHKPSFSAALSRNQVPAHLLHAVCTLAAVHSKQPRVRTSPPRLAGRPFAEAAVAEMFDAQGRLVVERNLATAQALVLLEMNDFTSSPAFVSRGKYHDLAVQILQTHDLSGPDQAHAKLSGEELARVVIENECKRRTLWLVHSLELMAYLYLDVLSPRFRVDLSIRLPMDETRFELADLAATTEPEYLHQPPRCTNYASEFGHYVRITSIFHDTKRMLRELLGTRDGIAHHAAVAECEHTLQAWLASLPNHLKYSEENLELQLSMFETSSNSGAWCYCMIHILHASCALGIAIDSAKRHGPARAVTKDHWAAMRLMAIVEALGSRARNSVLKGIAAFPLAALYGEKEAYLAEWQADFEKLWELKVVDLALAMESRLHLNAPATTDTDAPTASQALSAPATMYPAGHPGDAHSRPQRPSTSPQGGASPTSSGSGDFTDYHSTAGATSSGLVRLPSLPSLKDSGLLNSWDTPQDRADALSTLDTAYPPRISRSIPSVATARDTRVVRRSDTSQPSLGASVPAGMPWLADELR